MGKNGKVARRGAEGGAEQLIPRGRGCRNGKGVKRGDAEEERDKKTAHYQLSAIGSFRSLGSKSSSLASILSNPEMSSVGRVMDVY
jgi:hypothetical protein